MSVHHPFSPSKLERLELCPGSFTLEAYEEAERDIAEEGTQLHSCVPPDAAAAEADTLTPGGKDLVLKCRQFLKTFRDRMPGLAPFQYEKKLRLIESFEVVTEGTADAVALAPDSVVVVDWKFGFKEVTPADRNIQILAYGAMAMQETRTPLAHVYLYNPRLEIMTHAEVDMRLYNEVRERIVSIRAAAVGQSLVLNPSEKACEYCPAKAGCPALKRQALALATVHSSQISDPVAMGQLLQLAKLASKWADSVEYHAKSMAMRGLPPQGYALQTRKGRRYLTDPQKTFDALSAYFTPLEFMGFCTIDVKKLEDAYYQKAHGGRAVAKTRAEFETLLVGVLARGQETMTLVAK